MFGGRPPQPRGGYSWLYAGANRSGGSNDARSLCLSGP